MENNNDEFDREIKNKAEKISEEFDSRWATREEFCSTLYKINIKTNLAEQGGIPLYSNTNDAYIDEKDSHSLIIGATGSKKTRLIGMPSLRLFAYAGESFIATDPKAELYEKTYLLLKALDYNIIVVNLRDPLRGNSWNPLLIPYHLYWNGERDRSIEMISDLSHSIIASELSKDDPYWQYSASDFLTGLILILFECALSEEEINFKSLAKLKAQAMYTPFDESDMNRNFFERTYIKDNFFNKLEKSSFVYSCLSGTVDAPEKTRGSIVSTFDQHLRPFFSQDNLITMLARSDFDFDTLGKQKTALFLIMQDEKTTYHKLVSIFIKQCYEQLIASAQKTEYKKLPVRVNFLLDEFSSLPKISDFPTMITAARSRNIRFNLIIQSMHQLKFRYNDEAETIKSNCNNWVYLTSKELPLLRELSELSGNKRSNIPLITVAALQRLNKEKGQALVFQGRQFPFVTQLLDIDNYPRVENSSENKLKYPFNTRKVENIFDFKEFCENHSNDYFKELFLGYKPTEKSEEKEKRTDYKEFDFSISEEGSNMKDDSSNLFNIDLSTDNKSFKVQNSDFKSLDINITTNYITKKICHMLNNANYDTYTNIKIGKESLSFLAITNNDVFVIGVIILIDNFSTSIEIENEINTSINKVDKIYNDIKKLTNETLDDIKIDFYKLIVTPDSIVIPDGDIKRKLIELDITMVCLDHYENNQILKILPHNENVDNKEDYEAYKEYVETVIDYFKSNES